MFTDTPPLRYAPTRIWRAMKFKVLLRKRGGARAPRVLFGDQTFRWFMLSMSISCFMTRHAVVELVELSADRSKDQAGGEWGAWLGMQVRQSARPLTCCCRCIR